jgi:hypothetical protein
MAEHGNHDWMEHAVKHPGALTRKAKAAGESLSKFESQHHDNPTTRRQVALAKAFKKANHKKSE